MTVSHLRTTTSWTATDPHQVEQMGTDLGAALVEPLATLGTPATITVTGTSARIAITSGVRGVRVTAVGDAMFLMPGDSSVTAAADDHYLADGATMEFRMGSATHLAAIQVASGGTLYVTELG